MSAGRVAAISSIADKVVRDLWKPAGKSREAQVTMMALVREDLAYQFRQNNMTANRIEVRLSPRDWRTLVVECIVDGAVKINTYAPKVNP